MLNLLTKTKPWMVASLLVATSVFAQDNGKQCAPKESCKPCPKPCPQPTPPTQMCPPTQSPCCPPWPVPVLNAAYNYPARTTTRCPWDMYFDASFIYWQPIEENIEPGVDVGAGGAVIAPAASFKPGFKVGLGGSFDYDNWDLHAEYTWFHTTEVTTYTASAATIQALNQNPAAIAAQTSVNQNWRLRMDIGELLLGRWHYVGTKFTIHPTVGLRGAWIRQRLLDTYNLVTTKEKSSSWAVGPQVGIDSNWMICEGFRFYTNAEADILYTRYTRLSTQTSGVQLVSQNAYGTVRTHLDLEMGLGWGTYLDCNNWYFDLTAGYGFQVFFDQNMFRRYTQNGSAYTGFTPAGNLYIQGLTVTARLDF